jgi:hypothetical protein
VRIPVVICLLSALLLLAACGGSGLSAIARARRAVTYFAIFPPSDREVSHCSIPDYEDSGLGKPRMLAGTCSTEVLPVRRFTRVEFVERWRPVRRPARVPVKGGWIVTVGPRGIRNIHVIGHTPPQLVTHF